MINDLHQNATNSPPVHPGVIAVVDDDTHICAAIASWYELGGFTVCVHLSAESLLRSIKVHDDHVSVATGSNPSVWKELVAGVFDLNLPGISGLDLARHLRSMSPMLPLVIISSLSEEERATYGRDSMDIECLQKPFNLDMLDSTLFPMLHTRLFNCLRITP